MKNKKNIAVISIGIVCLLMAFLVTMQIKSVIYNSAVNSEESLRVEDLLKQLNDERAKNDSMSDLIAENSEYSQTMYNQLEKAEILAGLVEVQGSGVTITVKDSTQRNTIGDANAYVIHDSDLLMIINELCDAGAEAISLNGERIVSTTEIRCAGSTVSVNNSRYAQPFTISAIGDPVNLENALLMRDGVYDTLTTWGLEISIKKVSNVVVPAYIGSLNYKYAKPVIKEGGAE